MSTILYGFISASLVCRVGIEDGASWNWPTDLVSLMD